MWNEELLKHQSVHHLEAKARTFHNRLPWSLGPLRQMKGKSSALEWLLRCFQGADVTATMIFSMLCSVALCQHLTDPLSMI
jgi:hypothetical protein